MGLAFELLRNCCGRGLGGPSQGHQTIAQAVDASASEPTKQPEMLRSGNWYGC